MTAHSSEASGPLALLCGGGVLPFAVADAVLATGRQVVLFAIEGAAEPQRVGAYRHHWVGWGRLGGLIAALRKEGCRDIVMIGSLRRPPLWRAALDVQVLKMLPTVMRAMRGGDNHLLSAVAAIAEQHGFRIVAAQEAAPGILVGAGDLTARKPDAHERDDIRRGMALLHAMGPFDVGQGVVVIDRHIIAVEGIEGTDAMLARVAELRRSGRIATPTGRGVLVKAPKPQQDRRVDLPAIGPTTIEHVSAAGLAGIAVAAGEAICAEPEAMVKAADRAGVFVAGVEAGP
jgi:DUF1009 family protein